MFTKTFTFVSFITLFKYDLHTFILVLQIVMGSLVDLGDIADLYH